MNEKSVNNMTCDELKDTVAALRILQVSQEKVIKELEKKARQDSWIIGSLRSKVARDKYLDSTLLSEKEKLLDLEKANHAETRRLLNEMKGTREGTRVGPCMSTENLAEALMTRMERRYLWKLEEPTRLLKALEANKPGWFKEKS